MPITFRKVHYTVYKITCEGCGESEIIDTRETPNISNRREALRKLHWVRRRDGTVNCPTCAQAQYWREGRNRNSHKGRRYAKRP